MEHVPLHLRRKVHFGGGFIRRVIMPASVLLPLMLFGCGEVVSGGSSLGPTAG